MNTDCTRISIHLSTWKRSHLNDLYIKVMCDQCKAKIVRWPWGPGVHGASERCVRGSHSYEPVEEVVQRNSLRMSRRLIENNHPICPDSGHLILTAPWHRTHCYHFTETEAEVKCHTEVTWFISKWSPGRRDFKTAFFPWCPLVSLSSWRLSGRTYTRSQGNGGPANGGISSFPLTASKCSWGHFMSPWARRRWTD